MKNTYYSIPGPEAAMAFRAISQGENGKFTRVQRKYAGEMADALIEEYETYDETKVKTKSIGSARGYWLKGRDMWLIHQSSNGLNVALREKRA